MDHADRSTDVVEHPIRAAVRAIDHALKAVVDVNPSFMTTRDKSAALVELAEVESRLAELRLRVTADADDVAETTGARDVACWTAAKTRRRRGDCAREQRLATVLSQRPLLAAAVRGPGRVNLDQAHAITASLADLPTDVGAGVSPRPRPR